MREELDAIVQKHNLINRTFEAFWKNYDSYLIEEPGESKELGLLDRNSIYVKLYGYSFSVRTSLDFDSVIVYIDFFKKGETIRTGSCWCIYKPDGDLFDDYFVCD